MLVSPRSIFWTVRERSSNRLGKPFLVHLPSRIETWSGFGKTWEYHAIDWERIRWLR